jgi:hypothetical protein
MMSASPAPAPDLRLSELCVQLVVRGAAISLGVAALAVGALLLL